MADVQKPVEVPEAAPVAAVVVAGAPVEAKPAEETPAEAKPVEEAAPVAAAADEPAATEDKKAEVKPVEDGFLSHKAQGASFPKNLIASKEFFFFGTDAMEPKALSVYQKNEKSPSVAHNNIAWASHTGKGLLFQGDKKAPSSVINLSDATEPEVDGPVKFFITAKGNKHTFKASSGAERDNWVSQLKLKIAEAKELLPTITEHETYKKTLEGLKPAPVVVKKPEEPVKEEAVKTEEAPKTEEPAKVEEPAKEAEAVKEAKTDEPKARSSSRKRHSFFGFGNKKDEKKEEPKKDEAKPEESAAAETVAVVAPAEALATEPASEPVAEPAAATEADKPEEAALVAEEKPAPGSKRNSFFGGVFGKKEKKSTEIKPSEAAEVAKDAETAPTSETAPVIPPVEATTPLGVEVASPATVPTETVDATPTNGETKKETKEKRKSSLPFAFGKREKSPAPAVEGEDKTEKTEKTEKSEKPSKSAFSKLRATIKGKSSAPKAEDKTIEEPAKEEATTEATPAAPTEPTVEQPAVVEPVEEIKPENVASSTPAVTAAA